MGIVNQVAFPTVARLQGELPRLRARLLDASRLLTFVSVPMAWGISAVAPEFVRLAFGERWTGVVFPLQVVSLVGALEDARQHTLPCDTRAGQAEGQRAEHDPVSAVLLPAFLIGTQWGINGLAVRVARRQAHHFHNLSFRARQGAQAQLRRCRSRRLGAGGGGRGDVRYGDGGLAPCSRQPRTSSGYRSSSQWVRPRISLSFRCLIRASGGTSGVWLRP